VVEDGFAERYGTLGSVQTSGEESECQWPVRDWDVLLDQVHCTLRSER